MLWGTLQRRNPLKSGQAFKEFTRLLSSRPMMGRNPLKSGQAFKGSPRGRRMSFEEAVAIPSNRVKRSKVNLRVFNSQRLHLSQSPQIGSSVQSPNGRGSTCPTAYAVAIPSNRVKRSKPWQVEDVVMNSLGSQSPQIGSSVQSRWTCEGPRYLRGRRNPLKSGQAFKGPAQRPSCSGALGQSQSPQIGSSVQSG